MNSDAPAAVPDLASDNLESFVAKSCRFTKETTATQDRRQHVPPVYYCPAADVRLLCARLILEEALETVRDLGFHLTAGTGGNTVAIRDLEHIAFHEGTVDMLGAIDGCCDTIYVATGALLAMGAPDVPHMAAVCQANDAKFPGGVIVRDAATGKYLKPPGWTAPDHQAVAAAVTAARFPGMPAPKLAQMH